MKPAALRVLGVIGVALLLAGPASGQSRGLGEAGQRSEESDTNQDQAEAISPPLAFEPRLSLREIPTLIPLAQALPLEQERPEDREREEAQEQRERDDLIAQQGMNDAAQAMLYWAKWQTGVAVAGAFGLLISLGLTLRAIAVERNMGIAQTRAYLHVSQARIIWAGARRHMAGELQPVFNILLTVANTGVTPARWYEIEGEARVQEFREERFETISEVRVIPLRWGIVPPGAPLTAPFYNDDVQAQLVEAAKDPVRRFRIDGIVRYMTQFGEALEARFSFFTDGHPIQVRVYSSDPVSEKEARKAISMTRPTEPRGADT